MTETNDKRDAEEELVLDWDDAVDSWGQELDGAAQAEAAPFPTQIEVDSVRPQAELRPRMYRPPTDEELAALDAPPPSRDDKATEPPPKPDAALLEAMRRHLPHDPFNEDHEDATQIAAIPRELIESLARAETSERELKASPKVTQDDDSFSIAIEDIDVDAPDLPRDTDPSQLTGEGSGVFAPQSVRPLPPPPLFAPDQSGTSRMPTRTIPAPPQLDGTEEPEPTRVLDLAAEGIELPGPSVPPPPPLPGERARSLPPPLPEPRRSRPPARAEHSVLQNLDELAPPEAPERPAPAPAPAQPVSDRGAATALRTVRTRKPRRENLPLVAADDTGKRARIALCEALAAQADEARRPALYMTAGELSEELGETERAERLYELACAADARHVASLTALARLALGRSDYARYFQQLERLVQATLEPHERARVLGEVALLHWLLDGDLPGALRAAAEAERLVPDDFAHTFLLSRLELACATPDADVTLDRLASATSDLALKAVWLSQAGLLREHKGDLVGALAVYRRAATDDPRALDALLGLARTARKAGDLTGASDALARAAATLGEELPARALRRTGASFVGSDPGRRSDAAAWLRDASDLPSLRTAAQLAHGTESEPEIAATWAEASHGVERALALLTLAEAEARAGRIDARDDALASAGKAAPELALVPVVRQRLLREAGDASALAELAASDEASHGPLSASAKLAGDASGTEREVAWLERSRAAGTDPWCTDTLLIDAAIEAGRAELVRDALQGELERVAPHARVSVLLTLADLARRHGGPEVHEQLSAAFDADTRNTLLLRAYARSGAADTEVARAMRREAETSSGARAAFAYLRAGFALADDHDGRLGAFAAAYDAAPSYLPSVWALHHEARRQGALDKLHELHAREAGRSRDPHETVAHLVRAALVRANSDTDAAALQLARGLDLMPTDPVLRELVIRLGDAVPASLRAEAIQRMAEHAPIALERPSLLAAAGAFEDANQPARAASLYEAVLAREPHDPIAHMGFERAAVAAGKTAELIARRTAELSQASTPAARVKLLEDLLYLDAEAHEELVLQRARELLELEPEHPSALRHLERATMQENDVATLFEVEARMLSTSQGPLDRAARLRALALLAQLRGDEGALYELDDLVLRHGPGAAHGSWIGRQLLSSAAARADREATLRALEILIAAAQEPAETLTLMLQRAHMALASEPELLEPRVVAAKAACDHHPLTAETLAQLYLAMRDPRQAAEYYEQAGDRALDARRKARLYYAAGRVYQDQLKAPDRARDLLRKAAEADLTFADVQSRLESLLSGRNDLEGLIQLSETRLKAGGTPSQIAELKRQLSKLYERRGDKDEARKALEQAHAVEPDNLAVLRDVADAYEREGNYRECAEALIRLARLSRDPVELRETFFKLGELYDMHLPDARRAEAAYRRVLKLGPRHVKALERLSALYRREGQRELAAEALERLLQALESPARRREVAFELAKLKEDQGDARSAEETLENLRRQAPEDLYVLRGLADFYRRNKAQTALAMHLNRAINDLRQALEADFDDAALWTALVEMLDEKQRRDAARASASAAFALGLADAGVAQHTDNEGNIPGVGGAAFSELLDDLVFPEELPGGVRILFRYGAEALNRAAPFDVRVVGGEKLDKRHPLRALVQEMARWVNASDIEIYVTPQLPFAFVPVSDTPVQLLVGKPLLDNLSRGEQQFLVARALKIARAQMSVTCRIRPDEMALMLLALVRCQVPDYAPPGVDMAALEEMVRRLGPKLTKRAREDMAPHLMELTGAPFDASRVYWLASTAGNRAGLLATGALPSALSALAKLAGSRESRTTAALVAHHEEARELLRFAVSEGHFEARQRAGADRR